MSCQSRKQCRARVLGIGHQKLDLQPAAPPVGHVSSTGPSPRPSRDRDPGCRRWCGTWCGSNPAAQRPQAPPEDRRAKFPDGVLSHLTCSLSHVTVLVLLIREKRWSSNIGVAMPSGTHGAGTPGFAAGDRSRRQRRPRNAKPGRRRSRPNAAAFETGQAASARVNAPASSARIIERVR